MTPSTLPTQSARRRRRVRPRGGAARASPPSSLRRHRAGLRAGVASPTDPTLSPKQRQARAEIRELEGCFKVYHRIMGRFPSEAGGLHPAHRRRGAAGGPPMDPVGPAVPVPDATRSSGVRHLLRRGRAARAARARTRTSSAAALARRYGHEQPGRPLPARAPAGPQRGLTLIEICIALVIAAVLFSAVVMGVGAITGSQGQGARPASWRASSARSTTRPRSRGKTCRLVFELADPKSEERDALPRRVRRGRASPPRATATTRCGRRTASARSDAARAADDAPQLHAGRNGDARRCEELMAQEQNRVEKRRAFSELHRRGDRAARAARGRQRLGVDAPPARGRGERASPTSTSSRRASPRRRRCTCARATTSGRSTCRRSPAR